MRARRYVWCGSRHSRGGGPHSPLEAGGGYTTQKRTTKVTCGQNQQAPSLSRGGG